MTIINYNKPTREHTPKTFIISVLFLIIKPAFHVFIAFPSITLHESIPKNGYIV